MDRSFEILKEREGYGKICGIDEVGRGCLFGDVVSCAIIMPNKEPIEGVMDSKKLTPKKRDALYELILKEALAVGIGRVSPAVIDEINIKEATKRAMLIAVERLRDPEGKKVIPDFLLIDAETLATPIPQKSIIHGDDLCYSIACASIIAKVYRDRLCMKWDKEYPQYGIGRHKGYGTKLHREGILAFGETPLHRKTFLKKLKP